MTPVNRRAAATGSLGKVNYAFIALGIAALVAAAIATFLMVVGWLARD